MQIPVVQMQIQMFMFAYCEYFLKNIVLEIFLFNFSRFLAILLRLFLNPSENVLLKKDISLFYGFKWK